MTRSDVVNSACDEMLRDVEAIVARIVAQIRREFPEYTVVTDAEQTAMVVDEMRNLILGFRDRRPPAVGDAAHGEMLGRRRAEQGIPIETLLGAYNTGYNILWNDLRDRALARDPSREAELLPLVNVLMAWLRSMTSTVAEGYAAATAARDEDRLALAQTFVTGLSHGGAASDAVEAAARGLGFDPAGTFQVICASAGDVTPHSLQDLRRQLRGPAAVVALGRMVTITVQRIPAEAVLDRLGETPIAGVGLARAGLAGAAESLTDAERALALAERRGTAVHFEHDWLLATLLPQASRLRPLAEATAAENHPHLAEAVRAYAGHHFSITASAEALHVHANTVKYRLTRWQEITGWDPRTLDGLMRSLVSLDGCEAGRADVARP
ncbi:hypothetical protein HH310_13965 [Actinoplanes sp. TBRC 11911]|uniref:PucR family transcriptional regulator n=1 Tax=Actinoplanes sp. TBRC 11911 TaxID=2729386 RepID=UPI00145E543E|nr:helix-turn-helix domain-containing protein [Actinoplanes sp. TBRC 11911]NMO52299.1 hypothetical protein [Actinoplanes sp. TBRC 11911]